MKTDSLLGVWTDTVHNSNGWDMKIAISIPQPAETSSMLGDIQGSNIRGETIDLQTENLRGECGEADSDSLELLSDRTLLDVSKGKGSET